MCVALPLRLNSFHGNHKMISTLFCAHQNPKGLVGSLVFLSATQSVGVLAQAPEGPIKSSLSDMANIR